MTKKYGVSKRTIGKRINNICFYKQYCEEVQPDEIVLLIDTTFFGQKYGYMIFRAWYPKKKKGKNILRYRVGSERNYLYKEGYNFLIKKGWKITAIVCDGRSGLLGGFGDIPTQLCIFHMKKTMRDYLTKKPKLIQKKKLKNIVDCIGEYPEEDIMLALNVWFEEENKWLNEKNSKGKFIHIRALKAYKSLKRRLKRCYEFAHYPELGIPKTNNSLESINGHLKTKMGIHRGLKLKNKISFTNYYLYIS